MFIIIKKNDLIEKQKKNLAYTKNKKEKQNRGDQNNF